MRAKDEYILITHDLNTHVACIFKCFNRFCLFSRDMCASFIQICRIKCLCITTKCGIFRDCFNDIYDIILTILWVSSWSSKSREVKNHTIICFRSNEVLVSKHQISCVTITICYQFLFRINCFLTDFNLTSIDNALNVSIVRNYRRSWTCCTTIQFSICELGRIIVSD